MQSPNKKHNKINRLYRRREKIKLGLRKPIQEGSKAFPPYPYNNSQKNTGAIYALLDRFLISYR